MATLTQVSETGDFETFAKTIGFLLETKWGSGSAINGPKPKFFYNEDTTNIDIPQRGKEAIAVKDGATVPVESYTSADHSMIGDSEMLEIIVQAGSIKRRKLFENEIKLILTDNRPPRTSSFIKKKNGSNSAISDYDEILPPFIPFGIEDRKGRMISSQSAAILTVIYTWEYTA